MARLKSSEPKTKLDRIREVDAHYDDLLIKNSELHARQEEVHAEIQPLAEQARRSQVGYIAQIPRPKPQQIKRSPAALALVGDLISPQPEHEINPPAPRPSWPGEQRLRELGQESEAVSEAIKLLVPEISRARKDYSKKVAAQRGAEYTAIVERIVDAAKVLGDALLEHHEFINQQRLDGVSWRYFNPLNVNYFGDLDEDFSPLRKLILDAVEKRHVSAGQNPSWKMPVELAYLQGGS